MTIGENLILSNGRVRDHSKLDIICPTCLKPFNDTEEHIDCIGTISDTK